MIIKDKRNVAINNSKFNISTFKISLYTMEKFFILIINNKYTKNALILKFLLRILLNIIDVFSYFSS